MAVNLIALFLSDEALNEALLAGRNNPDFWSHATAVADAKAWHVSLDRPTREGKRREYPPEQIEWYTPFTSQPENPLD
jgi:hypothetical protein